MNENENTKNNENSVESDDEASINHQAKKVEISRENVKVSNIGRNDDNSSSESVNNEITLCISDASLQELEKRESFSQKISRFFRGPQLMTQEEFEDYASRVYKCCLKSVRDLHELHTRRLIGAQLLNEIVHRARGSQLTISHVIHITWSIMSCIHHFQLRLRTGATGPIYRARLRKQKTMMKIYHGIIRLFKPAMHRIVLTAILTFYREGKLWEVEFACTDLIVSLMEIHRDLEEGINDIILTIENSTRSIIDEARHLTVILYTALRSIKWPKISEDMTTKFLAMLDSSIVPRMSDDYNYVPLRKGLEMCIKNMMLNVQNKDLIRLFYFIIKRVNDHSVEDALYSFGNLGIHAVKIYRNKALRRDISKGPFPLIFGLFYSRNPLVHLLGVQIWQNLIDRNDNASHFFVPKVFFQECNYKLNIAKPRETERAFFKSVRNIIYEISMAVFMQSPDQVNIENNFQAIALTLVEIPCGYTASCYVTVAMSLQEYALKIYKEDLVRSNHLHAVVVSMMTLICYIHNAKVFYSYVSLIMERRAEWAPHLNPPLKSKYEYAQHHILWNKPELFFEDWEARYGLWKCFRGRKGKKKII